jgi:hypothetical protein
LGRFAEKMRRSLANVSPNSVTTWTRSPIVIAPTEIRQDPTAMRAVIASAGSASSAGSNPARIVPPSTRASRSCSAFASSRAV